jgi:SM-20-related protein
LDGAPGGKARRATKTMLDLTAIGRSTLQSEPYAWAEIDGLFSPRGARALAESYPRDHFKTVSGHDGEKQFLYEARSLIGMGAASAAYGEELSQAWLELAHDLLSSEYRTSMSLLAGRDLTAAPVEANVFHYGPGSSLGPHLDLPAKLVTHVLYFNRTWNPADGGCLSILRSRDAADVAAKILPLAGNSSVLVRSDRSWHAVQPVVAGGGKSRRSVTVTFYRGGAVSTMWPPGDATPLHRYEGAGVGE